MNNSVHQKLNRVRKPRVHIKYDVETEDGVEQKELPFVVGVLGDFSADATEPLPSIKERKFINIDRDNFNTVMNRMKPGLKLRVDNKLSSDKDEKLSVNLKFESLADFEPENIVNQVESLKALKEVRDKLRDLLTKSDRSDKLESLLEDILQDSDQLKALAKELGLPEEHSKKDE